MRAGRMPAARAEQLLVRDGNAQALAALRTPRLAGGLGADRVQLLHGLVWQTGQGGVARQGGARSGGSAHHIQRSAQIAVYQRAGLVHLLLALVVVRVRSLGQRIWRQWWAQLELVHGAAEPTLRAAVGGEPGAQACALLQTARLTSAATAMVASAALGKEKPLAMCWLCTGRGVWNEKVSTGTVMPSLFEKLN